MILRFLRSKSESDSGPSKELLKYPSTNFVEAFTLTRVISLVQKIYLTNSLGDALYIR